MAVCRLMILDFTRRTGRFDEEGRSRYDAENLREGIVYAAGLLELHYTHEPFYRFPLKKFIRWATAQLHKEKN